MNINPPQRWEYKLLVGAHPVDLNTLGQEGWELVSVVYPPVGSSSLSCLPSAYLKRPTNRLFPVYQ